MKITFKPNTFEKLVYESSSLYFYTLDLSFMPNKVKRSLILKTRAKNSNAPPKNKVCNPRDKTWFKTLPENKTEELPLIR
jgi:hypothetical protein